MIDINENNEPVIMTLPVCGVKGCKLDAYMLVGQVFVCGEHAVEYVAKEQAIREAQSKSILDSMRKDDN